MVPEEIIKLDDVETVEAYKGREFKGYIEVDSKSSDFTTTIDLIS